MIEQSIGLKMVQWRTLRRVTWREHLRETAMGIRRAPLKEILKGRRRDQLMSYLVEQSMRPKMIR